MIYFLAIGMVLVYYLIFILYYLSLFPTGGHKAPRILLVLAAVIASYQFLNAWNLLLLNFPTIMVIMVAGLRFCTGMNWKQAIYGGGTCSITAYCFRGIFTAVIALFYKRGDFLYNASAYYIITLIALPGSLLFLEVLRHTILPDDKLRRFLNNDRQLKPVLAYELSAVVNLVVINYGRSLVSSSSWYMAIALGACSLTLFMLIYAIHQSIRSTELLESQWQIQALEAQYARQLQHYKSYQKYTESFRAFRHDYKYMMGSLKTLIKANETEKAAQLLDDIYDGMQKKVQIHKKYSDNITLDALLQDFANLCEEKKIRFTFHVFAPKNTNLSLLDALRIFSNVVTNAIEACEKVPVPERFIEITSRNDEGWVTLEVVNSFNGEVIRTGKGLETTKPSKHEHGFGLGIVQEIAKNMGGFVIYDANPETRTFLLRVHIPRGTEDHRAAPPVQTPTQAPSPAATQKEGIDG